MMTFGEFQASVDAVIDGTAPAWTGDASYRMIGNVACKWSGWRGNCGQWLLYRLLPGEDIGYRRPLFRNVQLPDELLHMEGAKVMRRDALVEMLAYLSMVTDEEWPLSKVEPPEKMVGSSYGLSQLDQYVTEKLTPHLVNEVFNSPLVDRIRRKS